MAWLVGSNFFTFPEYFLRAGLIARLWIKTFYLKNLQLSNRLSFVVTMYQYLFKFILRLVKISGYLTAIRSQ